ncbi:MAG: hypothetical protein ACE5F9_10800 [Phycisphaerae bacterium]
MFRSGLVRVASPRTLAALSLLLALVAGCHESRRSSSDVLDIVTVAVDAVLQILRAVL